MATNAVIKDDDFELVSEFMQPDAKKRLSLGAAAEGKAYNVYKNSLGQLILDPVRTVPASEVWLYENPKALASVKQGLKEAKAGNTVERGSFFKNVK
jgi:hypothetical protein